MELDESIEIKKEGDKLFLVINYREEITEDTISKRYKTLKSNIDRLKKELDSMNVEEGIKMMDKKLETDRDIKKEALKNFDKYISDQIVDIKRNKEEQRKQIRQQLINFDSYKEKQLKIFKQKLEMQKEALKFQLKNDEKNIKIYKR